MMIHLEGINKTYFNGAPLHVLKGIDLDIEKGEMVSIMGASGSGKSTLLNALTDAGIPANNRLFDTLDIRYGHLYPERAVDPQSERNPRGGTA